MVCSPGLFSYALDVRSISVAGAFFLSHFVPEAIADTLCNPAHPVWTLFEIITLDDGAAERILDAIFDPGRTSVKRRMPVQERLPCSATGRTA